MRSVIASVQSKGGAGKTTVAICLAGEMHQRGHHVDVVDADPQGSAYEWGKSGKLGFRIREFPIKAGRAKDWVRDLETITTDFVVIDTPPDEYAVGAAVAIANIIVVPCTPSGIDLEATQRTLNVVRAVRERRHVPLSVLLVPNRVDARSLEGQQLAEELAFFGEVVAPPLGSRSAFVRAFSAGCTVADLAPGRIADNEVKDFTDVVLELLGISPPKRQETYKDRAHIGR